MNISFCFFFRNIKKTEDEETVVNDNSFYFSESIENLSGDFNEIRKKLKSRQKKYNDNNSFKSYSNVHNSKDKFFKFSESSNSQKWSYYYQFFAIIYEYFE